MAGRSTTQKRAPRTAPAAQNVSDNAAGGALKDSRHESADRQYLESLGERVRELRARRGMSRKILSRDSGVSERYLAQLESGKGNISIILLRQLARALDTPIQGFVIDGPEPSVAFTHSMELLRRLAPEELERVYRLLLAEIGETDEYIRHRRIALVGLRGAGKSTLGQRLADELGYPFVELDKEIEKRSGMPLATLFDLYGQPGFRRLERNCLEGLIESRKPMVIATGGSLVSEAATFERLLSNCLTVWIKASATAHMERVIAQGDMRPMANNREAMADLHRILKVREPLYKRADAEVDTTQSIDSSFAQLLEIVRSK